MMNAVSSKSTGPRGAMLILVGIAAAAGIAGYGIAAWLGGHQTAPLVASTKTAPHVAVVIGDGVRGPRDVAWIPGGEFLMGSDHQLAQSNERPTHRVRVHGFWMDRTHVTNAQFRAFVEATRYVTTAERKPEWASLQVQLPAGTPRPPDAALVPGALVFVGTDRPVDLRDVSQWWTFVPGANWKAPGGPGTTIAGKDDHPVVQVSFEDVLAYAKWVGKRLPTEAEWEYAARGGLEQATYAWGEQYQPGGQSMANIWEPSRQGRFPVVSPKAGGAVGTLRVGTFPPNGYGLVDMTGNAWQWTADFYRSDYFALQKQQAGDSVITDPHGPQDSWDPDDQMAIASAPRRVIRGGSFLCNSDYCLSYRPSARRGNDPFNPMNHIGFRLVSDAESGGAKLTAGNR